MSGPPGFGGFATRSAAASFSPLQMPELTKYLSWADVTDTGTFTLPDKKGGAPATQTNPTFKPVVTTAPNGVRIGTFNASVLTMPLSAAVNDNTKFGMACWLKLNDIVGNKTIMTIQNVLGGASADKLLYLLVGGTLQVRAMTVDRRAQVSAVDTNWRHVYLGIDCGKIGEPAQVLMAIDGVFQAPFFNTDTAWPATLGTPTGSMYIGAASAAAIAPIAGSMGDLSWFSDQLSVASLGRLMNFNRPF